MKVFILAGGFGTRMHSLFPDLQKIMIPIGGRPFLERQIRLLSAHGFRDFVICAGYRSEQVENYFKSGAALDVSITYSVRTHEEVENGTGYAIRKAAHLLSETSLVLNGDTHLPTDYRALVEAHLRQGANASIALSHFGENERSGQVLLGEGGRITAFLEKQALPPGGGYVSAGAYVFEPAVLEYIPEGPSSLEHDIFPALAAKGQLCGIPVNERFIDIGVPEGLRQFEEYVHHERNDTK